MVSVGIAQDSTWEVRTWSQQAAVSIVNKPVFIDYRKISQKTLLFEKQHLERLQGPSRYFASPFDQEVLKQRDEKNCQSCNLLQDYPDAN